MAVQGSTQPGNRFLSHETLLLTAAFILPALVQGIFGWAYGLLAIPVLCLLVISEPGAGNVIIRNSVVLATAVAIFFYQMLPAVIFSFTFIPLGYILYSSGKAKINVAVAAGQGVVILALTWVFYWTLFGMSQGINAYSHLLATMDSGLAQTYELYQQQADLPAEVLWDMELLVTELREIVPRILPGLLGCIVVMTVWINQVVANAVLLKVRPERAPWPRFKNWQIPEKFVWVAIGIIISILLGPEGARNAGLSVGLVCTLIYFFQGLAILVYLLGKWNVPGYFRIIIYMIVVVQSFGFIMLTVLGLADVWTDFRKLQQQDQ